MKQSPVQMRFEAIRKIKLQSRNQAIWQFEREDTRKDFDCSYHSSTSSDVIKNGNKKTLQDLNSWDEGICFEIKTTLKRSQIRDYYRNYHRNCYRKYYRNCQRKFNSDQQLGYSFEKVISCGYVVVGSIIIGNVTGIIRGNIMGIIIGIIIGNWSHSEEISADQKLRDGN